MSSSQGGSYTKNKDGEIELVQRTLSLAEAKLVRSGKKKSDVAVKFKDNGGS